MAVFMPNGARIARLFILGGLVLNKVLDWLFKPNRCKVGLHDYVTETVIRKDAKTHQNHVTTRLQCVNCPHHTNGWTFPRRERIARFR